MLEKRIALVLIGIIIAIGISIVKPNSKVDKKFNPNWEFEEGVKRSRQRKLDSDALHLRIKQLEVIEIIKSLKDSTEKN